jgi:hypothetical protein
VLESLTGTPIARAVLWTLYGVGFWVGGVVLAHYLWERYRSD